MERWVFRWEATFGDAVATRRRVLAPQLLRGGVLGVLSMWGLCALVAWGSGSALLAAIGAVVWPTTVVVLLALAPRRQIARARRAGNLTLGPCRVTLDAGGARWEQEGADAALCWDAVRSVTRDRVGLWLDVGLGQRLLVPARALSGVEIARIEAWRAAPGALAPVPWGEEVSAWTLQADLTLADWLVAVRAALTVARRYDWPRLVRLLLLIATLGWVLHAVAQPGGLALAGWLGLVFAWSITQSLVGPRVRLWRWRRAAEADLRQLPLGPSTWRVGPGGVWVQSSRGTTRYTWSHVGSAERDAEQVRLAVGLAVLVLPARAFASEADLGRFLSEVRSWIEAAPRLRDGRPVPPRGAAPTDPDPFAPPPDRR